MTTVCIIGFALLIAGVSFFTYPGAFATLVARIGLWGVVLLGVSTYLCLVAFGALWFMKRWGVLLYAAVTMMNILMFLAHGGGNLATFIFPLVTLAIGFSYYKQMS